MIILSLWREKKIPSQPSTTTIIVRTVPKTNCNCYCDHHNYIITIIYAHTSHHNYIITIIFYLCRSNII